MVSYDLSCLKKVSETRKKDLINDREFFIKNPLEATFREIIEHPLRNLTDLWFKATIITWGLVLVSLLYKMVKLI